MSNTRGEMSDSVTSIRATSPTEVQLTRHVWKPSNEMMWQRQFKEQPTRAQEDQGPPTPPPPHLHLCDVYPDGEAYQAHQASTEQAV